MGTRRGKRLHVIGSHDELARADPPPWGRRRRDRLPLLLLSVLSFANIGAGLYLLVLPRGEFDRSPIWRGALQLLPAHDPRLFGGALLLAGCVLPFAFARRVHLSAPGILGLGVGGASWGLLAGSFGYAAVSLHGLGALGAVAAVSFCALHLGVLYLERR